VPLAALAFVVLVPLAILLGTAWLFGWKFQPVETGSMAPAMTVGSLAVVQPADPTRIGPGSIIVFVDGADPSRLVAHRVIRQLPGTPVTWETKGDANRASDSRPVPVASVRGVVGWSIPWLGTLVTTVRGVPAFLLLVALPLGILVVTELASWRRRQRVAVTP
jgi:signal peptidase